jgi:hypothetical protein
MYNYIEIGWKRPITPTQIFESNWQDSMINYTSWPIILPNMKVIRPTTSEEMHSQKEERWKNEWTDKQMEKTINYMPSYYRMPDITTHLAIVY